MNQRYLSNVVTLELDTEKCTGCGTCLQVCPHGVLALENKKSQIIDRDACMECGACALNCPVEAIISGSGVGCAIGIIKGALRGAGPDCCSATDDNSACCG